MQSKKLPQPEEYFSYDRLEEASKKLHLNPMYQKMRNG